ncbi:MAG: hypothetical protein IJX78_05935 [Bacilli bacterium]|nr:hypothetical protein [Bacilli bacterium]
MIKKIWEKTKNLFIWIWKECKDWHTLLIFGIVWCFVMSPSIVGYLLFFITKNGWHLTYATGWILFWAGPFTPTIPLCIVITFGIKKLLRKREAKKKNKNVDDSNE